VEAACQAVFIHGLFLLQKSIRAIYNLYRLIVDYRLVIVDYRLVERVLSGGTRRQV
jgi:hypothetical protein